MDAKKIAETRWWRIQMHSGAFSCGEQVHQLRGYVLYCVERGIEFTVSWWDTSDEAHTGMTTGELADLPVGFPD